MDSRRLLVFSLLVLLGSMHIPALAGGSGRGARIVRKGEIIRLENEYLALDLNGGTGKLRSITNFKAGCRLSLSGFPLEAEVLRGDKVAASSIRFLGVETEERGGSAIVVLTYGLSSGRVSLSIGLEGGKNEISLRISFRGVRGVRWLSLPSLSGMAADRMEYLIIPGPADAMVRDPTSLREIGQLTTATYPSFDMRIQLTVLGCGSGGFYIAAHDREGAPKKFSYRVDESGRLSVSMMHGLSGGSNPSLDYEVVIGAFSGDWREAASRYRDWALAAGLEAADPPDWVKRGFLMFTVWSYDSLNASRFHSFGEVVSYFSTLRNLTSAPAVVRWKGWERGGAWSFDPLPPNEGYRSFKEAVDGLHSLGYRVVVGLNVALLPAGSEELKECLRWNEDGKPVLRGPEEWWTSSGKHSKSYYELFLGCRHLQERVRDLVIELAKLGVDGVQLDSVFLSPENYNPEAGPVGPWRGYSRNITSWLRSIREDARRINPDFALVTEGIAEPFLSSVDLFIDDLNDRSMVHWALKERLWGKTENVPLFDYIYREEPRVSRELGRFIPYGPAYLDSLSLALMSGSIPELGHQKLPEIGLDEFTLNVSTLALEHWDRFRGWEPLPPEFEGTLEIPADRRFGESRAVPSLRIYSWRSGGSKLIIAVNLADRAAKVQLRGEGRALIYDHGIVSLPSTVELPPRSVISVAEGSEDFLTREMERHRAFTEAYVLHPHLVKALRILDLNSTGAEKIPLLYEEGRYDEVIREFNSSLARITDCTTAMGSLGVKPVGTPGELVRFLGGLRPRVLIDLAHTDRATVDYDRAKILKPEFPPGVYMALFLNQLRHLGLNYDVARDSLPDDLITYDLVVLVEPDRPIERGVMASLVRFVRDGGSLLIFGDAWTPSSLTTLYSEFGVRVIPERYLKGKTHLWSDGAVPVTDFADHYITRGVEAVISDFSMPMNSSTGVIAWIDGEVDGKEGRFAYLVVGRRGSGRFAVFADGELAKYYQESSFLLLGRTLRWLLNGTSMRDKLEGRLADLVGSRLEESPEVIRERMSSLGVCNYIRTIDAKGTATSGRQGGEVGGESSASPLAAPSATSPTSRRKPTSTSIGGGGLPWEMLAGLCVIVSLLVLIGIVLLRRSRF